jgi:hypothetical protein
VSASGRSSQRVLSASEGGHRTRQRFTPEFSLLAAGLAGAGVLALLYRQFSDSLARSGTSSPASAVLAATQALQAGTTSTGL